MATGVSHYYSLLVTYKSRHGGPIFLVYRLRRRSRIHLLLSKSFILASASSSRSEGETREEAIVCGGAPRTSSRVQEWLLAVQLPSSACRQMK